MAEQNRGIPEVRADHHEHAKSGGIERANRFSRENAHLRLDSVRALLFVTRDDDAVRICHGASISEMPAGAIVIGAGDNIASDSARQICTQFKIFALPAFASDQFRKQQDVIA
ncbi:MAG: hypothetical protein WBE78_17650 [Candidatus Binataceae bacterium]